MTTHAPAPPLRQHVADLSDGSKLVLALVAGTGADTGKRCIQRVTLDASGRVRSEIVYFYDGTVSDAHVDADFDLLAGGGLVSMGQLHHTESMLNRGPRMPRMGG